MKIFAIVIAVPVLTVGCASGPPEDPFEGYNRSMFSVNEKLDNAVTKPAAKAYTTVTPAPVRSWVSNFFGNLSDPWIALNNLLQGKPVDALSDAMRFVFNSTLGLGGLLDIASEAGIPKHDEDFGQTLGVWGVDEGVFLVLPFFGPRSLRDTAGIAADTTFAPPTGFIKDIPVRNSLTGLRLIDGRANVLGIERTLEEGTLDKYRYSRDFYLQQRRAKVNDGELSLEYEDFDSEDSENAKDSAAAPGESGTPKATGEEP